MGDVKIKRIKREHKKISTKEKLLAGLGAASGLAGIAGVATPAVNIVSTQNNPKAEKVKQEVEKIFGVPKAQAFEDDQDRAADQDFSGNVQNSVSEVQAPEVEVAPAAEIQVVSEDQDFSLPQTPAESPNLESAAEEGQSADASEPRGEPQRKDNSSESSASNAGETRQEAEPAAIQTATLTQSFSEPEGTYLAQTPVEYKIIRNAGQQGTETQSPAAASLFGILQQRSQEAFQQAAANQPAAVQASDSASSLGVTQVLNIAAAAPSGLTIVTDPISMRQNRFKAYVQGQNLKSDTVFDVKFTDPHGTETIADSWQTGMVGTHAADGLVPGKYTITGIRVHGAAEFVSVNASIKIQGAQADTSNGLPIITSERTFHIKQGESLNVTLNGKNLEGAQIAASDDDLIISEVQTADDHITATFRLKSNAAVTSHEFEVKNSSGSIALYVYATAASAGQVAPVARNVQLQASSGGDFYATLSGDNITDETYFDIRVSHPNSAGSGTVEETFNNWQQGTIQKHNWGEGAAAGRWTIIGVRSHADGADHRGDFVEPGGQNYFEVTSTAKSVNWPGVTEVTPHAAWSGTVVEIKQGQSLNISIAGTNLAGVDLVDDSGSLDFTNVKTSDALVTATVTARQDSAALSTITAKVVSSSGGWWPVTFSIASPAASGSPAAGAQIIPDSSPSSLGVRQTVNLVAGAPTGLSVLADPMSLRQNGFKVYIEGKYLPSDGTFDVKFTDPQGNESVVDSWQRGLVQTHSIAGVAPGTYTITGVRVHDDKTPREFVGVNASFTVPASAQNSPSASNQTAASSLAQQQTAAVALTANGDFVKKLYLGVQGRESDSEGFTYWVEKMDGGLSKDDTLWQFINSAEFKNNVASGKITPEKFVDNMYQAFRGTSPGEEKAGLASKINNQGSYLETAKQIINAGRATPLAMLTVEQFMATQSVPMVSVLRLAESGNDEKVLEEAVQRGLFIDKNHPVELSDKISYSVMLLTPADIQNINQLNSQYESGKIDAIAVTLGEQAIKNNATVAGVITIGQNDGVPTGYSRLSLTVPGKSEPLIAEFNLNQDEDQFEGTINLSLPGGKKGFIKWDENGSQVKIGEEGYSVKMLPAGDYFYTLKYNEQGNLVGFFRQDQADLSHKGDVNHIDTYTGLVNLAEQNKFWGEPDVLDIADFGSSRQKGDVRLTLDDLEGQLGGIESQTASGEYKIVSFNDSEAWCVFDSSGQLKFISRYEQPPSVVTQLPDGNFEIIFADGYTRSFDSNFELTDEHSAQANVVGLPGLTATMSSAVAKQLGSAGVSASNVVNVQQVEGSKIVMIKTNDGATYVVRESPVGVPDFIKIETGQPAPVYIIEGENNSVSFIYKNAQGGISVSYLKSDFKTSAASGEAAVPLPANLAEYVQKGSVSASGAFHVLPIGDPAHPDGYISWNGDNTDQMWLWEETGRFYGYLNKTADGTYHIILPGQTSGTGGGGGGSDAGSGTGTADSGGISDINITDASAGSGSQGSGGHGGSGGGGGGGSATVRMTFKDPITGEEVEIQDN